MRRCAGKKRSDSGFFLPRLFLVVLFSVLFSCYVQHVWCFISHGLWAYVFWAHWEATPLGRNVLSLLESLAWLKTFKPHLMEWKQARDAFELDLMSRAFTSIHRYWALLLGRDDGTKMNLTIESEPFHSWYARSHPCNLDLWFLGLRAGRHLMYRNHA